MTALGEAGRGILGRLAGSWFLVALAIAVAIGLAAPEAGRALRATPLALPLLTATALFVAGLGAETSSLRAAALDVRALVLGLGALYVAAPLLAAALARALAPGDDGDLFFEAVMIAAAQAGTIASAPALTLAARGNQGLAILLTMASNSLTVLATPIVLALALGTLVSFPLGAMALRMALVVLLPVALGQAVRPVVGTRIDRALPALRVGSQAIILVFVFVGVAAASTELAGRSAVVVRLLAVAAALHVALLALVWWASGALGLPHASRVAVLFCGTQKTLPNGIYLWDRFFGANPFGALAIVAYHVLQLVVDSLLVPSLRGREVRDRTGRRPRLGGSSPRRPR